MPNSDSTAGERDFPAATLSNRGRGSLIQTCRPRTPVSVGCARPLAPHAVFSPRAGHSAMVGVDGLDVAYVRSVGLGGPDRPPSHAWERVLRRLRLLSDTATKMRSNADFGVICSVDVRFYACPMVGRGSPVVHAALRLGYWIDRYEPYAVVASGTCFAWGRWTRPHLGWCGHHARWAVLETAR
jgi:hypothetical protein